MKTRSRALIAWWQVKQVLSAASKTYTDAGLLPLADAVTRLPSFTDSYTVDSQIDSQSLSLPSHALSVPVTNKTNDDTSQAFDKESLVASCQCLSRLVRKLRDRARCRVRTCDFLRVKQALYH